MKMEKKLTDTLINKRAFKNQSAKQIVIMIFIGIKKGIGNSAIFRDVENSPNVKPIERLGTIKI